MTSQLVEHQYASVAKGAIRLDLSLCRQCLECEEICPTGVLVMPVSENQERCVLPIMGACIVCRYCLISCPDKALSLIPKTDGESYP